jgi:adenosylhomocysteine nucleosidase
MSEPSARRASNSRASNSRASNSGVQNTGPGTVNVSGSVFGNQPTVLVAPSGQTQQPSRRGRERSGIGVITVLSEETSAVVAALETAGHGRKQIHDGARFYEASIDSDGIQVKVVATQALNVGPAPTMMAFDRLRRHYDPPVMVLVGIAGGIHSAVALGDVVVVREVIYYDARKETPGKIVRRGQTRPIPATIRHAVNDFFSSNGEPYAAYGQDPDGTMRDYKVLPGPIGTGQAVIADENSAILRYLASFNDKTLAVETEAEGLAEAFYETAGTSHGGWLAIRGISDHANADKDDAYHQIASWHAAAVLLRLAPFLAAG